MDLVGILQPSQLADIIQCKCEKVLIVDARTFCEFNTCHIINAVNVWCSKIRKKRLQQNSISVHDFLQQACHISLQDINYDEVVVYDQSAKSPLTVPQDTFLYVLLGKLASTFNKVYLLQGGFLEFQSQYYEMCEDSSQKGYLLTSFSQPCMPVSSIGPTKILPFLFLGSQHDANNNQLLLEHNISYELNVSTTCPQPEFLQDSHFLRIAVNDNFSAKLLPHFGEAFRFIDKVREVGGRVLVHCLAGISRSPTIVISYVMKYLHLHYDEAYRYVKTRRPTISPNINFVGQLLEFDLHLFGKRVTMRSPLRPIYVDDNDLTSSGVPSSVNSPLLKSSSSSCLTSGSEMCFPFPLNRSLPSLRLNKSVEEVQCGSPPPHPHLQSPYSPPAELDCILFDFKVNESGKTCSSGKLPSSPVSTPSSPDFPVSYSNFYGDFYSKDSMSSTGSIPGFPSPSSRRGAGILESMKSRSFEDNKGCSFSAKSDGYRFSSTNKENEDITIQENGGRAALEDRSCVACCDKRVPSKKESFDEDEEMEVAKTEEVPQGTTDQVSKSQENKREERLKSESFRLIIPSQHTYLKRENSAPEHAHSREDSLALPPKTMRSSSCRKVDLPHLPRSYSSSETYLNTRMRLEKQCSAGSVGSHTRKSFSSDEVGRGFQGTGPPPTPPSSAGFHKDSYINPLELARCDSWSTSGLGSEISDWDSVQGDVQSMEDAQGPFDAVFAEVFPGECQTPTFKDILRKTPDITLVKPDEKQDKTDLKSNFREKKSGPDANSGSRKSCSALVSDETLGSSPAPRPVSLPGVSGTYNVADSNLNNADMGVEIDDSRDWTKEDGGDKLTDAWIPPVKKGQILIEHPPVDTKTMGDDVKYIMTWYKFDSTLPSDGTSSSTSAGSLQKEEKELEFGQKSKNDFETTCSDLNPLLPLIELTDASIVAPASVKPESSGGCSGLDSPEASEANCEGGVSLSTTQISEEPLCTALISGKPLNTVDESKETLSTTQGSEEPLSTTQLSEEPLSTIQMSEEPLSSTQMSEEPLKATQRSEEPLKTTQMSEEPLKATQMSEEPFSTTQVGGEKDSLHERWQWWDNEFKKKIRNIKKNVSLTSWDSVEGDDTEEESGKMAGFHLAQELMQSMEDLLEREICEIKERASSLSTRFGLQLLSDKSSPSFSACDRSDDVTTLPAVSCNVNNSQEIISLKEVTPPLLDKISACPLVSRQGLLPKSSEGSLIDAYSFRREKSLRARSEPPLCVEENLYRVKSCPGIPHVKSIDDVKQHPQKDLDLAFFSRFPKIILSKNGHCKRYSCSALDFRTAPPKITFESCPDVSQSRSPLSSLGGNPFGSKATSSDSPSSFNLLLKVS